MKILFITSNQNKLKEARSILQEHDLYAQDLNIPELQSLDPKEIIEEKLRVAEQLVHDDYVVLIEDVSFTFGKTGLPGPLIKWFLETVKAEGIQKMAKALGETTAQVECHIGVLIPGETEPQFFVGKVTGKIVPPKGEEGFGFDTIFSPENQKKTFAEMTLEEKNKCNHRQRALQQLHDFLKEKF